MTKNILNGISSFLLYRIPEDDEEDVEGDGEMRDGVDKIDHGNCEM